MSAIIDEAVNWIRKNRKLAATLLILLLAYIYLPQLTPRLAVVSQYQGIHPQFIAIWHRGNLYTNENPNDASVCRIHPTDFNFDPDDDWRYLPNLQGELRDIQIVRDLRHYVPSDAYTHILQLAGVESIQPDQPYKVYEWELNSSDGFTHKYRMELWLCSLQINMWVTPDDRPYWEHFGTGEQCNQRYTNTEVWLKLKVGPYWYFEGANHTYFGLAYMELAEFMQEKGHEDPDVEVAPESKWVALPIYYSLLGAEETPEVPPAQAKRYEGKLLNPKVFRDEWFTKISLFDFGTFGWDWFSGAFNTDSVQWRILVHVFVVGEWVVKPEIERNVPTHPSQLNPGWGAGLANWLMGLMAGIGQTILMAIGIVMVGFVMVTYIMKKVGGKEGGRR